MTDQNKGGFSDKNCEKIHHLHELRQGIFGRFDLEKSAFARWASLDEDLAVKVSEFFVGGLYQREVLSQRERELCAVAALTAIRAEKELKAHIRAARNVGASREDIAEVIFQMITYAGMPAFVEALDVAVEVFENETES
ncbi:MAG: carboxymuconolactone decarboxylase family protein [Alphaproteobacteria bacterium]|nr:MAG: carboxymuconolactone decarboxylase family protein [Alphaproteobacteria bacterium]